MVGQELHQDEKALEPRRSPPGTAVGLGRRPRLRGQRPRRPRRALAAATLAELTTLSSDADHLVDTARSGDWTAASATVKRMISTWTTFRASGVPGGGSAPKCAKPSTRLATAVGARNSQEAQQAALEVARRQLDLQLRYRPAVQINLARFQLWTRQLMVDAAANNAAAVHGDVTTLAWIRDRIALDSADGNGIDDQLRYLRSVADAHEFKVAMVQAARLRVTLAGLKPTP